MLAEPYVVAIKKIGASTPIFFGDRVSSLMIVYLYYFPFW